jgi:hypothetical protein
MTKDGSINFGALIAFLLPGFLALWGISFSSPEVAAWMAKSSTSDSATVGGFLYATLASLALGLVISAARWVVIDQLLYSVGGLERPNVSFAKLKDEKVLSAFREAIENHYRYYQYYSHSCIAIAAAFAYALMHGSECPPLGFLIGVPVVVFMLLLAARNELKRFWLRAREILE